MPYWAQIKREGVFGCIVNIKLTDKYFLTADSRNYILNEKYDSEDKKALDGVFSRQIGYFNSLNNVVKSLIRREVWLSDNKDLIKIDAKIEDVGKEISDNFSQYVDELSIRRK